jgi:hypothetical protein
MFGDDAADRAMGLPLVALPEIAVRIFSTTANLLNLFCDIIFVDTSSTYFELDVADGEVDLAWFDQRSHPPSQCRLPVIWGTFDCSESPLLVRLNPNV